MTSAKDFHLISWRNFLGLASVVVAVLIPVGIRWLFRGELQAVQEVQATEAEATEMDGDAEADLEAGAAAGKSPLAGGEEAPGWKGKSVDRWLLEDSDDESGDYDDEPLPPPPPPATQGGASSSWTEDKKGAGGGGEDIKLLG